MGQCSKVFSQKTQATVFGQKTQTTASSQKTRAIVPCHLGNIHVLMELQIQLWKSLAQPFQVPCSIHRCRLCDWELIDWDVAGCTLCGKIHECKDAVHCPLVTYEGRHVCEITGFYTRRNVFVDDEFVDTVANVTTQHIPVTRSIDHAQIEAWVEAVLCSEDARKAVSQEITKRSQRCKAVFVKFAKQAKTQRTPVNVLDLCTLTAQAMANIRNPVLLEPYEAKSLAASCVERIDFFCRAFLDALRCTPPSVKMHGFVVGLLYLMRTGLVLCGNVEVVPRIPELALVLPSENHVKVVFKMSTKIMTEVENFIKITVRTFTRDKLISMGFRIV